MTEKERIGASIKKLRKEQGVSTYQLKDSFHASTPNTIELGQKNYTIDKLLAYLDASKLQLEIVIKPKPEK